MNTSETRAVTSTAFVKLLVHHIKGTLFDFANTNRVRAEFLVMSTNQTNALNAINEHLDKLNKQNGHKTRYFLEQFHCTSTELLKDGVVILNSSVGTENITVLNNLKG